MKHKYKVTNENREQIIIICNDISELPTAFSLTEDGDISETVIVERIE